MQNYNIPGTDSLLKDMLIKWSMNSDGTKDTANFALPRGWTCVGIFRPCVLTVISKFPSPAWLASTETGNVVKPNVQGFFSVNLQFANSNIWNMSYL